MMVCAWNKRAHIIIKFIDALRQSLAEQEQAVIVRLLSAWRKPAMPCFRRVIIVIQILPTKNIKPEKAERTEHRGKKMVLHHERQRRTIATGHADSLVIIIAVIKLTVIRSIFLCLILGRKIGIHDLRACGNKILYRDKVPVFRR